MPKEKAYEVADRAWQPVVGCDPTMPCAKRCWARRTVARVVKCQEPVSPERAAFFQVALTPDGGQWSGKTFLDEAHLTDPLKWRKPAVIATGFHGDWGRLAIDDMYRMLAVMALCPRHHFMPLTKCPESVSGLLGVRDAREMVEDAGGSIPGVCYANTQAGWPLPNVTIGCSVMYQSEADKMLEPMAAIAALGWHTHVWYEPALGPVEWSGWEFLEQLIIGGESGSAARAFDIDWARESIGWCRRNDIAPFVKQLGAIPRCWQESADAFAWPQYQDPKGGDSAEWPVDLRVREYPSWMGRSGL